MPTTTETINYDSFLTTTIKDFSSEVVTQAITNRPGVALFFDKFRHTSNKGGRTWQGIADYGQNSTVQFFNGADTFNTQPQQVAQPVAYDWKYLGGGISMTKTEMLENRGPVALASLVDLRMKQLFRTFDLTIGNELFSDGTNFGGKSFFGLAAAISTTGTNILGGLDPASFPFWSNNTATSFGSFAANGPNGTTDSWITVWNNCTDGGKKPDFIISSQSVWESYHKTCNAPVRFVRPDGQGETGDVTWQELEYMGRPWYWDRQCVAGRAYMIRKDHTHFMVDPGYLFEWTAPLTAPDQLTFTKLCGLRFFFRTVCRMFSAVVDGVTA